MRDVIAVAIFEDFQDAQNAIRDLEARGVSRESISLISRSNFRPETDESGSEAGIGAAVCGLAGILAGFVAIPGLGPVIAAGPIAAALTGAGIGAATGSGVVEALRYKMPRSDAELCAEAVRRGLILVAVQSFDRHVERVLEALDRHNPVDITERVENWGQSDSSAGIEGGWKYTRERDPKRTGVHYYSGLDDDREYGDDQAVRGRPTWRDTDIEVGEVKEGSRRYGRDWERRSRSLIRTYQESDSAIEPRWTDQDWIYRAYSNLESREEHEPHFYGSRGPGGSGADVGGGSGDIGPGGGSGGDIPPGGPSESPQLAEWHFRASMDSAVQVNQTVTIEVIISRDAIEEPPGENSAEASGQVDRARKLVVQVIPRKHFVVKRGEGSSDRAEIDINASALRFERYFDVIATAPGEGEILVVARQGQDPIVSLTLKASISESHAAAAVRTNAEANGQQTRRVAQNFQLRIHDDGDKGFTYEFDIPGEIPGLYPPLALEGDKVQFISDLFTEIETYWKESVGAAEVFKHKLRSRGSTLAGQLLPVQLRQALWKHRDKIDTIVVLSTEPFIPWELLLVDDPNQSDHPDARFLAEMGLIRWLYNQNLPETIRVRPGLAKYVIPDYCRVKDYYLPSTAAEGPVLGNLLGAKPIDPTYLKVLDQLKEPGAFDILHFAGHGEAEYGKSNVSRILLQGRIFQGKYHRESIDDGAVKLSAHLQAPDGNQPFIFLNACQTGRSNYQLTSMGGFAEAFLSKGAGAFVSSLWVIGDLPANTFTKELYSQLAGGATLAQATVQARKAANLGGDPTWLAYTVYGRPECRLQKVQPSLTEPG